MKLNLEKYFSFLKRRLNISNERIIKDLESGKTKISRRVIPLVKFNMDTGEVENFGTWDQAQIFNDDITIATVGKKIKFGDGDSYLTETADDEGQLRFDVFRIYTTGASLLMSFTSSKTDFYKRVDVHGSEIENVKFLEMEQTTTPTAVASHGQIYCVDNAGTTELWFQGGDGTDTQLV
jgi:hypothetical protein